MGNKASHATASQQALNALLSRPSALQASMFDLHATAHHGVPSNAKVLAFCGLQGILAVGTASGAVKLYGGDGLEFLLDGPESASHLAVGVTHLKFTARQRLVVGYTDSSMRVFDLASGAMICSISDAWTTSVLTSLETISYANFPFFFVATDDGDIHVVHEETGRVSTYVIRPQDLSVPNAEGVTAMASHPRDANLLLIAYDTCPVVLMWDFAKRKVVREFMLSGKTHKLVSPQSSLTPSESSSADGECAFNSPQSLSWHSSGKRFVAGYKHGGFAVFRTDKSHGLYRHVAGATPSDQTTSVKQIKWVSAPPTSRHAALPGAIVFSDGRSDPSESNLLTIIYPPNDGRSSDDTLTDLFKVEKLTWLISTMESVNRAEIAAFEAAQDQVDYSAKVAPLSLILLSGNPLDGCLPTVSVQCLPCFVKLCDNDKEEWEWRMDRLPEPMIIPPLLQLRRGSGKLEMFHVQSATKMGEILVDPEKVTSLSSIIMVDGDGKCIEIPGQKWSEQAKVVVEDGNTKRPCADSTHNADEVDVSSFDSELVVEKPASNDTGFLDDPATVPRAADMAMGPKEIPAQPLASIELHGPVLATSVVRIPVSEGIENCLAVIDQSNRVYILTLLSLKPIWEVECNRFGFGLGRSSLVDGILSDISYGAELVVANAFGEIERFSLFAESTAMENAMLERMSIKTRLHHPERVAVFDQAASLSAIDSGKKRGIAADAGKMFKKLVLSVTHDATDLNKEFLFSTY
ncbi:Hypothetical protein PHPALM_15862, partial [Phytophthora palmivora]